MNRVTLKMATCVIGLGLLLVAVTYMDQPITVGAQQNLKSGQSIPVAVRKPGEKLPGPVSQRALAVKLLFHYPLEWKDENGNLLPESASQPADLAVIHGRIFVLDTNNGRILEIGQEGQVANTLDRQGDPRLMITGAMAITAFGGKLYLANSIAGEVLILEPTGRVERVVPIGGAFGERRTRLIGIAVTRAGAICLSDADNQFLYRYSQDGELISFIGNGERGSGDYTFNGPGYLTLDTQENLYVVDMLNYWVKKYSPAGALLLKVGKPGITEGTFSRPKAVVVDARGNIYVSDGLLAAIQVFDSEGHFIGFIGRRDPSDINSDSLFQVPNGMKILDHILYVVDRYEGLFAFDIRDLLND